VVIDLHTHSAVSDGTQAPADLVAAAAAAGIDVLALADHDTTAGLSEAAAAGAHLHVEVVPAIEVSTTWRGADVHLLAYWPDVEDEALQQMLGTIRGGRRTRIPAMLAGLAAHGIELTEDDVRRAADGAASLGRPHVADALAAAGFVGSRDEAFATLIGEGMPGHVRKSAPPLPQAIDTVRAAGGVPVLAHPWGRGSRAVLDKDALAQLADHGLAGIEVDHLDHDSDARDRLRSITERLGLVATGGSDYHGAGKAGVALGMNRTTREALEQLTDRRGVAP
jgi:predicted metal-dependent phosphoesterase TrpH